MHPVMQLGIEKSRAEETRILPVKRGEEGANSAKLKLLCLSFVVHLANCRLILSVLKTLRLETIEKGGEKKRMKSMLTYVPT